MSGYYNNAIHLPRIEACAEVARLALGCKLYAGEKGGLPSSLEQLTPEYFKELPRDPFTGKNFIYRTFPEGGFAIYSVGLDEQDNLSGYGFAALKKMTFNIDKRPHDDILWLEKPARSD